MYFRNYFLKITLSLFALLLALIILPLRNVRAEESPTTDDNIRQIDIVGGQNANLAEYPWQAMLLTTNGTFICGGSLIAPNWVLTAAHCLDGFTIGKVILGAYDRTATNETGRQMINVKRQIKHPNFNSSTFDNDIALLELTTPAVTTIGVKVVPFVVAGDESLFMPGVNATITGWGATSEGGTAARFLQEVTIPVIAREVCNQAGSYNGQVTNNMLCAGLAAGGKDSCQGDSGGPLIVPNGTTGTFKLAGVVSWGNGCARPRYYGIYTVIANYTNWIGQYVVTAPPVTVTPPVTPSITPSVTPPTPPPATVTPSPSPTPSPTPTTSPIKNGNLESGRVNWTEYSRHGYALIDNKAPVLPHSGTWLSWLSGANNETSRMTQSVKLPSSGPIYLNYYYQITSEDVCERDYARVVFNTTRMKSYNLCRGNQTNTWVAGSVNLSAYVGTTVSIQFYTSSNGTAISSFYVDDISIGNAPIARSAEEIIEGDEGVEDNPGTIDAQSTEENVVRFFYLPLVQR